MPRNKIESKRRRMVLVEAYSVYTGVWNWRVLWCPATGVRVHRCVLKGSTIGTHANAIEEASSLLRKMRYIPTTDVREYYGSDSEGDE